jgi:hypothetical protein
VQFSNAVPASLQVSKPEPFSTVQVRTVAGVQAWGSQVALLPKTYPGSQLDNSQLPNPLPSGQHTWLPEPFASVHPRLEPASHTTVSATSLSEFGWTSNPGLQFWKRTTKTSPSNTNKGVLMAFIIIPAQKLKTNDYL